MASAVGSPSTMNSKGSKIPVSKPSGNSTTTRSNPSANTVKKPPYESRKSAEELKLRLASAVSAKIASGKNGRSLNRGIGYLLQRKEGQQESRLNTKDISFQKAVRNEGRKVGTGRENDDGLAKLKSVRNADINKTQLQKSLLGALMNSRTPSGASSAPKKGTRLANTSSLNSSTTTKSITGTSKSNDRPLSTTEDKVRKPQSNTTSDPTNGKILERAKNIQSLLGQSKQPMSLSLVPTIADKDSALHKEGEITERKERGEIFNAKRVESVTREESGNFDLNKMTDSNKMPETTGKNERDEAVESSELVENARRNGDAVFNDKTPQLNGRLSLSNTAKIPLQNGIKKIPPPVAKKPSKTLKQALGREEPISKSTFSTSETRGDVETTDKAQVAAKDNSPLTRRKATPSTAISGKETVFKEDLLEKLEADVGRCKIATFQSMEDFSALRMKAYRVRSELDQLKRDREKRTALVC